MSADSINHADLELQEMSPEHVMQLTRNVSTAITQPGTLAKPVIERTVADDNIGIEKGIGHDQNHTLEIDENSDTIQGLVIEGDSLFEPEHAVSSKEFDSTRPAVDGQEGEMDHSDEALESPQEMTNSPDQHAGFAPITHKLTQYNAPQLDSRGQGDNFRSGLAHNDHSITPGTISTHNYPTLNDSYEEGAVVTHRSPILGSLLDHTAPSSNGQQDGRHDYSNNAEHTEGPQPIEQLINSNAMKRHMASLLDGPGSFDMPSNGSNGTPKRRKKDIDSFKAKVEGTRKVMEESLRRAEEERRKTYERQCQLEQEWEELQQVHADYERMIEESRRDAEAALREREHLESTSP
ncbi:MAG: hypothetical protein M1830_007781 [Pleopsidium flavum]|nr:MAG: hypothetical protein M1830_007781 [Pleopsidium flavum]